jgi:predicted DNA-binding ribbon-helix-helix protein
MHILSLALEAIMKSPVVKRSIIIAGHKSSVSLEDEFWRSLKRIAIHHGVTLSQLVTSIDVGRREGNLSSCLRLFILDFHLSQLSEEKGQGAASLKTVATRAAG